jgi:hypothetical protein
MIRRRDQGRSFQRRQIKRQQRVDAMPRPEKPPFANPRRITAGMATA